MDQRAGSAPDWKVKTALGQIPENQQLHMSVQEFQFQIEMAAAAALEKQARVQEASAERRAPASPGSSSAPSSSPR